MHCKTPHIVVLLAALGIAGALGGCASESTGGSGDPGASALPAGMSCQSIRSELNKLDAKGTQAKVEAANQGKKHPPAVQADVDRYNQLLNYYLGARCHV
ncbi:MAG: hypothetical protein ACREC6_05340 [Hyphomicrobiaceae bacterium]